MTNFSKKVFSIATAGAMVLSLVTPALADNTITISGNGSGSQNTVQMSQTNSTTVSQNNTATVNNIVTSNAETGANTADANTGGNTLVKSGNATSTTNVTNTLNSNAAQVAGCNCGSNTAVTVSGNGSGSTNTVGGQNSPLTVNNTTSVGQTNVANVTNYVDNNAKTGKNDASLNTGGSTTVASGNASSTANVTTQANANSAVVGGGSNGATAPSATFMITGNGAGSTNWITAGLSNTTSVGQVNSATIHNNVNSDAYTGENSADANTGGNVLVGSGNATSTANVDNMTNFNVANVDCGCTLDVTAKIHGNGAGGEGGEDSVDPSENGIVLALTNLNSVGSTNSTSLDNCVFTNAKTGLNDASINTGDTTDPTVGSGNATNNSSVTNQGNVNTVGGAPFVWPTVPVGNSNVGLSFNVQALLAFFGISVS